MKTPSKSDKAGTILRDRIQDAQTAFGIPDLGDFTFRDEANAVTAYAFRNGFLESIHAGIAGFSDDEMKKLMIESSAQLAALLFLKEKQPDLYSSFVFRYWTDYCQEWSRDAIRYELAEVPRRPCPGCGKELRTVWHFCPACGVSLDAEKSQIAVST